MPSDQYQYGENFQTKVISLMVQDPAFLRSYTDTVRPEFFEQDTHTAVARMVLTYFQDHNEPPTRDALDAMIVDHCWKYSIKDQQREALLNLVNRLFTVELKDADFVRENVVRFGKRQALKSSVIQIVQMLEQDPESYEKAQGLIEEALRVGHNVDLGMSFFESYPHLKEIAASNSSYNIAKKVPTLLHDIDRRLLGGLGAGELGTILGSSGRGKSMVLTNFGAAAIHSHKRVVHFTVGDLHEFDVALRYAARLSGVPMDHILTNNSNFAETIKKQVLGTPFLRIKYYPPKGATVQTLRAYLSRLYCIDQATPDLIIVDYADKLACGKSLNNSYEDMGLIYDELIGMGRDFGAAVWTASQVRRDAYRSDIIDIDQISDSWLKIANADVVIPICQTPEERELGIVRLFGAKVRRGQDAFIVRCKFDKAKCMIKQMNV